MRVMAPAPEHMFPKLAGNVIAAQDDPASLIRIVIAGGRAASTDAFPTAPAMPSLGYRLSDAQIAAVVTFMPEIPGAMRPPRSRPRPCRICGAGLSAPRSKQRKSLRARPLATI